jgi:hypothetical protein
LIYLAKFPILTIAVEIVFVEEPAADLELDAANQLTMAHNPMIDVRPDEGYLMMGWRRVLRDAGDGEKWWYTQSDVDDDKPEYLDHPPGPETPSLTPDIYMNTKIFTNG